MKTYDFKSVAVIVGGRIISGFAEGDAIGVERDTDAWTEQVGAEGEVTRSKSNNKMGKITLRLQQASESNDVLMGLYAADQLSNAGVFPVLIKDNSGRQLHAAEQAWIKKLPAAPLGQESAAREWIIVTDALEMFVGGN